MLPRLILLAAVIVASPGCSVFQSAMEGQRFRKIDVQSYTLPAHGQSASNSFQTVSRAFLDRGFDIKTSSQDAGYITTEYKRFASYGTTPPFDYSLQIRAVVERDGGGSTIQLRPTVRSQNRLNAAAFQELELGYYQSDADNSIASDFEEWRARGLTEYMNVVYDLIDATGISAEDIDADITETPYRLRFGQIERM